jgi:predicted XRE-type DNA-binding protein
MAVMFRRYKKAGMKQQDIAALYGVNQGRVSEVVNGHKFPDILDQASLF